MRLIRFLLPVLLLAGCATTPVPDVVTASHTDFPAASMLPANWQLQGRISLTQGESGWHAGVDWDEQVDGFQLRVSGPLGQGGFLLTGDGAGVLLRDAGQQVFTAPNADTLLAEVTGWQLPVEGLRYWVRGIPDPGSSFKAVMGADGRLAQLSQSGWTIRYTRYQPVGELFWPARLGLVRDDVSVRLVIDRWGFGQTPQAEP